MVAVRDAGRRRRENADPSREPKPERRPDRDRIARLRGPLAVVGFDVDAVHRAPVLEGAGGGLLHDLVSSLGVEPIDHAQSCGRRGKQ
jgi:hypothetical protein